MGNDLKCHRQLNDVHATGTQCCLMIIIIIITINSSVVRSKNVRQTHMESTRL